MCSYNRVNGAFACENPYTLRDVLKKRMGLQGLRPLRLGGDPQHREASAAGLDQEQPMADYFGPKLKAAVKSGKVPMSEIDDHARRVLYAEFLSGIVDDPPRKSVVDVHKGLDVAQRVEEESIVLFKNDHGILPIDPSRVHSIAIIGGSCGCGHDLRWRIGAGGSARWQCHHASRPGRNRLAGAHLVPHLAPQGAARKTARHEN